jgi:ketol-acid reductoisomerase
MTPKQEAVLDLAVEQVLSPALAHVNLSFVTAMMEQGIPMEAILSELYLSGEVERTYRLLREVGFAAQLDLHSPASQYGQLSRRGAYDALDLLPRMRALVADIESGRFADEWDAESRSGYPRLQELKQQFAGPLIRQFEAELRSKLGAGKSPPAEP